MRTLILMGYLISQWILIPSVLATPHQHAYYGQNFYETIKEDQRDSQLKESLFTILNSFHIRSENNDQIVENCPPFSGLECYRQKALSYKTARKKLFGHLHLEENSSEYYITDVYCEKDYGQKDFPQNRAPGPGKIPSSNIINSEHTWPQSRFSKSFSKSLQKGDLHPLFPSNSRANSVRSNIRLGEVSVVTNQVCPNASRGYYQDSKVQFFEPPQSHKGNAARALFYFSVRYKVPISQTEENFLRQWHKQDPVDEFEEWRNEEIYKIQQNRNPFIDHPELVDSITDF